MRKNTSKLARKIRKAVTSLMLLLIFLLPLFLTFVWIYGIFFGPEDHKVYSKSALAGFHDKHYTNATSELKPCDEPVVTITFDDGWQTSYTQGLPVLQKFDIKGTFYVLGGHFKDPEYMSEAQVKSLQEAGNEVGAHTMTHPDLTTLSEDKLEWELGESDRQLSQLFGDPNDFATPLGASNPTVVEHAKKYYQSLRNTAGDPAVMDDKDINLCKTFDPYNINAYTVRDGTKPEDIKKMVDYTIERKGWLVLTYHQIDDSDSHWAVEKGELADHMQVIRESGIRTAPMNQVLDAIAKEKGGM